MATTKGRAAAEGSVADRLLGEAAALFREQGYVRTTVRQLGDRLGIRGPSLYHHIAGKEVLLHDICVLSLQRITQAFTETAALDLPPQERFRQLFRAHMTRALGERDMHATMLTEFRELSPAHRRKVVRMRAGYEALWRAEIEAAQQAGLLRTDVDARVLTLSLLNLLNWTIFWYEPKGRLSPGELAETFYEIYVRGAQSQERSSDTAFPPSTTRH